MKQKYIRFFRHSFQNLQLPFYPRGAGINNFEYGDQEESKSCPFCEISWVSSGVCEFHSGGKSETAFKGMCYLWELGEPHGKKAVAHNSTVIYYATFDGPGAVDILHSFGYKKGLQHSQECPVSVFNRIMRGLTSQSVVEYRRLITLYMDIITRMAEYKNESSDAMQNQLADECLYAIQSGCGDCDFNIEQLAERMKVHRSTIRRAVLCTTGKTPIEYLEECRMERSLDLLKNTSLPINTVACWSGFRRTNYFCRWFRMKTGHSPAELRAQETLIH